MLLFAIVFVGLFFQDVYNVVPETAQKICYMRYYEGETAPKAETLHMLNFPDYATSTSHKIIYSLNERRHRDTLLLDLFANGCALPIPMPMLPALVLAV